MEKIPMSPDPNTKRMHKLMVCKWLNDNKSKLSADRALRVQQARPCTSNHLRRPWGQEEKAAAPTSTQIPKQIWSYTPGQHFVLKVMFRVDKHVQMELGRRCGSTKCPRQGEVALLQNCGRCLARYYCNSSCQVEDCPIVCV